jgi:glutathione S-transferase
MAMLQLFHHPLSAPSRYVRLMLAEYEIGMDLVEERPWERRQEFLALNPAATLPVLLEEGYGPVCGALACGEYLDETAGAMMRDRRLMPENPQARAEVRRLVEWFLVKFEFEVARYLVVERVFKQMMRAQEGGGAPDAAGIRAGRNNLKGHMRYLAWLANARDWLGGSRITQADLAAAAAVSVMDYLGEIDWQAEPPAAREWYSRIKSRPSFRPLLADKVPGVAPPSHYTDLDF